MPTLGIIPARGGSKGIPNKNVIDLCGKPLIAWTIEAALACRSIDRLIVSTDDFKIADAARRHGADVPFIRPACLAADDTPSAAVISHAIEALQFDGTVALLQPTSPLRLPADISECIRLHRQTRKTAITVTATKIHPSWMFGLDDENRIVAAPEVASQRQQGAARYVPNGAVYVFSSAGGVDFHDAIAYVMPAERSIDIDTMHDLRIAGSELRYRELEAIAATY